MIVRLISVGKTREPYIVAALDDFRRRLRPYLTLEEIEVKTAGGSPETIRAREAQAVLKAAGDGTLWLLDVAGKQLASEELAAALRELEISGRPRLTLVVAGTFGAGVALRARADFTWSLSRLTFLHEWARAIVLEQLYRAAKISRNEPYHH